jgi:NADH-quinone oxidoreductase subunit J
MEAVVFFVFAGAVLAGSLGVVLFRHPVYAALSLVGSMIAIAVLFLQQDADLVAIVQIVVYASAITVLFLFVIMLLGVDRREERDTGHAFQRVAAVVLGAALLIGLGALAGRKWVTAPDPVSAPLDDPLDAGNVEAVAKVLFTDYIWAFEVVSVMLVIAVVGSVVLARRSRQIAAARQREEVAL